MNTAAKRSSGLSCPAARLPAAPSSSKGPCNLGRPLLVAASGGGGGSGGSGGSALLRRRQGELCTLQRVCRYSMRWNLLTASNLS